MDRLGKLQKNYDDWSSMEGRNDIEPGVMTRDKGMRPEDPDAGYKAWMKQRDQTADYQKRYDQEQAARGAGSAKGPGGGGLTGLPSAGPVTAPPKPAYQAGYDEPPPPAGGAPAAPAPHMPGYDEPPPPSGAGGGKGEAAYPPPMAPGSPTTGGAAGGAPPPAAAQPQPPAPAAPPPGIGKGGKDPMASMA
jgi:hypothetical protein